VIGAEDNAQFVRGRADDPFDEQVDESLTLLGDQDIPKGVELD
jgi:hypothetical protein